MVTEMLVLGAGEVWGVSIWVVHVVQVLCFERCSV